MPDPIRFDELSIALFVPPDTEESVADAAREALDAPEFRDGLTRLIRQFFATIPALNVLAIVVDV